MIEAGRCPWQRITGSLINLIPPLILIFGVLGPSIFGGIATPRRPRASAPVLP